MKRTQTFILSLALLLFAGLNQAQAQTALDEAGHWEWNVNSGVMLVEDELVNPVIRPMAQAQPGITQATESEAEYVLGTRFTRHFDNGMKVGARFSWSPLNSTEPDFDDEFGDPLFTDTNLDLYLYNINAGYEVDVVRDFAVFGHAGIGGATVNTTDFTDSDVVIDDDLVDDETTVAPFEDDTNLFVPLSVGLKWQPANSLAVTVKAHDNIVFVDEMTAEGDLIEDETTTANNFEFTAGLSFLF